MPGKNSGIQEFVSGRVIFKSFTHKFLCKYSLSVILYINPCYFRLKSTPSRWPSSLFAQLNPPISGNSFSHGMKVIRDPDSNTHPGGVKSRKINDVASNKIEHTTEKEPQHFPNPSLPKKTGTGLFLNPLF